MTRIQTILVASILAGLTAGCGLAHAHDCTEATGPATRESRRVEAFHAVRIAGAIDLELTQGGSRAVTIEAPSAALAHVETRVEDGVLIIDTKGCLRTNNATMRANVTSPAVNALEITGSGDARVRSVKGKQFRLAIIGSGDVSVDAKVGSLTVDVGGSGDVTGRGTATEQQIEVNGSGDVALSAVRSRRAEVRVNGSGDVALTTTESLDATINGSGSITYSGNPKKVRRAVHGSGKITAR